MKCHVLIDLKIREFSYADEGQMNMYLNYFKENIMEDNDALPVGIVLCTQRNKEEVHYAMKKNDQLDKLFEQWQKDVPELKGHFVKDGIVNEDIYNNQEQKVLFITKEPNNPKQEKGDFRDWWKEEVKYPFSYRIAEWAYGMKYDFPLFTKLNNNKKAYYNSMQTIAFMNVKKIGGKGSSDFSTIWKSLKRDKEKLLKQIEIIDPDIIVLGLTWDAVVNKLFGENDWQNTGYNGCV